MSLSHYGCPQEASAGCLGLASPQSLGPPFTPKGLHLPVASAAQEMGCPLAKAKQDVFLSPFHFLTLRKKKAPGPGVRLGTGSWELEGSCPLTVAVGLPWLGIGGCRGTFCSWLQP